MRRRHVRVPPDLTSLFDVLFIVIFAALIRAAAVQSAARAAPPPPVAPPIQVERSVLRTRALAELDAQLAARPEVVVRVAASGSITALELASQHIALDAPLLEHNPDPDVALAYLGDRASELRVCRIVALHLNAADLARYLVIVAPEQRLLDLPHALYEGLRRDVERCTTEQRGLAVLIGPEPT